jgi:hypothetical protein
MQAASTVDLIGECVDDFDCDDKCGSHQLDKRCVDEVIAEVDPKVVDAMDGPHRSGQETMPPTLALTR